MKAFMTVSPNGSSASDGLLLNRWFKSERFRRWRGLLLRFVSGQLAVQGINIAIGLAVLRWLPVAEYAKFGIAFAFQCTIGMLIDLGISNSIVALVGNRGSDPAVIGGFLKSAQHYRNRTFVVLALVAAVVFPLLTAHQPWSFSTRISLLGAVLGFVYVQRLMMYSAPLLIHHRVGTFYTIQISSAAIRLLGTFVLWRTGLLTAISAAWLSTVAYALLGWMYRRAARPLIAEPDKADPALNLETRQLLLPQVPAIVFTAFQTQISTGLIAILGSERSLAEVSALGRLGQLFLILNSMNSVLIEPVMARVPRSLVVRRYLEFVTGAIALSCVIVATAFAFPGALLLLLGSHYQGLREEVPWVVISACLGYLACFLCLLNGARKYRFWWYSGVEIFLVISTQVVAILLIDMRTTKGAVMFTVVTCAAVLAAHVVGGIGGLLGETRSLSRGDTTPAANLPSDEALMAFTHIDPNEPSLISAADIV